MQISVLLKAQIRVVSLTVRVKTADLMVVAEAVEPAQPPIPVEEGEHLVYVVLAVLRNLTILFALVSVEIVVHIPTQITVEIPELQIAAPAHLLKPVGVEVFLTFVDVWIQEMILFSVPVTAKTVVHIPILTTVMSQELPTAAPVHPPMSVFPMSVFVLPTVPAKTVVMTVVEEVVEIV